MNITRFAAETNLQFRSKTIVAYNLYHSLQQKGVSKQYTVGTGFKISKKFAENVEKLKKRAKYTGTITAGAKKRLTKAISLLIQSSPEKWVKNRVTGKSHYHKISFITLTLPNVEKSKDAKFCHKYLLQPLLRQLRNRYGMKSYVWKCELQDNGSIHYHVTTDLYIPFTDLKNRWNDIVRANGMLESFKAKYGHDNPNSTDIHTVNNIRDLEAYLVKYISKSYQNEQSLKAKVWDCSKNLKESSYFVTSNTHELHSQLLRDISQRQCKVTYRDRCVIMRYKYPDYYLAFPQCVIDEYFSHLNGVRRSSA